MQTEHLKITGMTCGGCVSKVSQALKAIAGVGEVSVSLAKHEATVQYDAQKATAEQLSAAVLAVGYGVDSNKANAQPTSKRGCC